MVIKETPNYKEICSCMENVLHELIETQNEAQNLSFDCKYHITETFIDLLMLLDNYLTIDTDKELGIYKELTTYYSDYTNDEVDNYISSPIMTINRMSKRFSSISKGNYTLKEFQEGLKDVDFDYFNISKEHIDENIPFMVIEVEKEGESKAFVTPICTSVNDFKALLNDFSNYVQYQCK